jgi:FkbM family methyltransferase
MSSNYWDELFLKNIDKEIDIIFEIGARYGDESVILSEMFPNAQIYSFECNPLTLNKCEEKLKNYPNVTFFPFALGQSNTQMPFYSYIQNNDGASSLLKRIDYKNSQKQTGFVNVKTLKDVVIENNIHKIDLLCMDVQGYELNILKGCGDFISKIDFVIMEEPNLIVNENHLPEDTHSFYINAPSSQEIKEFMQSKGLFEIERAKENEIECNVMYKNILV